MGRKMSTGRIVCNSSPIINLSKIDRLDLLQKLYQHVIIPQAVYDELVIKGHDKKNVSQIEELISEKVISVVRVKNESLVKALNKDLDYGESEAITLAIELQADVVIIDEVDARSIAELYNLKKTGFIGILIRAKNEGYIQSVKEYISLAMREGFWISQELYRLILAKIGEKETY